MIVPQYQTLLRLKVWYINKSSLSLAWFFYVYSLIKWIFFLTIILSWWSIGRLVLFIKFYDNKIITLHVDLLKVQHVRYYIACWPVYSKSNMSDVTLHVNLLSPTCLMLYVIIRIHCRFKQKTRYCSQCTFKIPLREYF